MRWTNGLFIGGLAVLGAVALAGPAAACAAPASEFSAVLQDYLDRRREAEGFSGIVAHIECRAGDTPVVVAAGTRAKGGEPMAADMLFEIGSNTKHFTAAAVGRLVEEGRLSFDDPLSKYLPQYPYWGDVTLRSLLDMTSPIPSYDNTMPIMADFVADPERHFPLAELVASVTPDKNLPKSPPWHYSNTNYILAAMVIEKVTGESFTDVLRRLTIDHVGLRSTYYFPAEVPEDIRARMASGYLMNGDCPDYVPKCDASPLQTLIGHDVRDFDLSWAGPAGGIVADVADLSAWVRALFGGEVVSADTLAAMTSVVSTTTGEPITVGKDDPRGFGLGLAQIYSDKIGTFWFYQGETMGYRAIFVLVPESGILFTFALNSAPVNGENKMNELIEALYAVAAKG